MKGKTIGEKYTEIMSGLLTLGDVVVLSFKFKDYSDVYAFHYDLIANKVDYVIFDGYQNGRASVVIIKIVRL